MMSVSQEVSGETMGYTGKSQRQEMKLLKRRCEYESYVKMQHAVQHL